MIDPNFSSDWFLLCVPMMNSSHDSHLCNFWLWRPSKIAESMLNLEIDPNLVVFSFCWKSPYQMASIQDGWHYGHGSNMATKGPFHSN